MAEWEVVDVFESWGLTVVQTEPDVSEEVGDCIQEEREGFVVVAPSNGGPPVFRPRTTVSDTELESASSTDGQAGDRTTHDDAPVFDNPEMISLTEELAYLDETLGRLELQQINCKCISSEIRRNALYELRKLTDVEQAQVTNVEGILNNEVFPETLRINKRIQEIQAEMAKQL